MTQISEYRTLGDLHLPDDLVASSHAILSDAIECHDPSHVFGMFSGGHDSLCATYLASQVDRFTGAAHMNTGVGIEETRKFVRDTCRDQGWSLYEYHATDPSYDELVLEKGFPRGGHSHNSMLWYLKQKQWNRMVQEHKREWRATGRVAQMGERLLCKQEDSGFEPRLVHGPCHRALSPFGGR